MTALGLLSLLDSCLHVGVRKGGVIPILCAHALNTSTDTNIDHTGGDLVGNVDAGLETRGALSIECASGSALGEASEEGGGAHLGGTTAGGEDGANADILNEVGVNLGALEDGLQDTGHEVGGLGILEATLATLGEGGTAAGGDDDLGSFLSVSV